MLLSFTAGGCWDIQERENSKAHQSMVQAISFAQGRAQIDGQEAFLAGIVYHPVPVCGGADYDFTADSQIIARDLPLLDALNVNIANQLVLRLVRPAQVNFLDELWQRGSPSMAHPHGQRRHHGQTEIVPSASRCSFW